MKIKEKLILRILQNNTHICSQVQNSSAGRGYRGSDGGPLPGVKAGAGGADPQVGLRPHDGHLLPTPRQETGETLSVLFMISEN